MVPPSFLPEASLLRDLRVYASSMKGDVFGYRDDAGPEADAVVVFRDGRWGLFEVKAGASQIEEAADGLKAVAAKIVQTIMAPPAFMAVLVASGFAYRRSDGVCVRLISCLRP